MSIQHFDTQEELDDEFDCVEDRAREEQRLKDAVAYAGEWLDSAHDVLSAAEQEYEDAVKELEEFLESGK